MVIALILFVLAIIAVIIPVIIVIYFQIYKRNINRALAENGSKHIRMAPPFKVVSVLVIVFAVCVTSICITLIPYFDGITTARDIEEVTRQHNAVEADWNIEVAMNDSLAAVLAYDMDLSDHTFAIYKNESELFPNYVFRYGGNTTSIERAVRVFRYGGTLALVSMNALHIAKIECHDGDTFEIDPDLPFVLILPNGGYDVYDSDGNLINLAEASYYEITEIGTAN